MGNERIETYKEICIGLKNDIRTYAELCDSKMEVLYTNLDIINADDAIQACYESKMIEKEYVSALLNEVKGKVTSRLNIPEAILSDIIIVKSMLHNLEEKCSNCHDAWMIAYHTMIEIENILRLIITTGCSVACYLHEIDSVSK